MKVVTYEGVVENGAIQLPPGTVLPDKAKVYVVVPGLADKAVVHIYSPRLAHPKEAADFVKEVVPEEIHAEIR